VSVTSLADDTSRAPPRVGRPRALAIIPCLDEAATIAGVIERLLDDPDWDDPLVVVADGGSTDGAADQVAAIAARDRRVRLAHNPKRVQSAALNVGVALFGEGRDWLIRADAHGDYPRAYVSTLVREAMRVGAASVTVSMRAEGRSCFQRAVACAQNSRLGTGGSAHRMGGPEGFVDHGHHALFDLRAFLGAGGYDESFSHNEDAELDVRLRRSGGRIWLTRRVEVVYHPRGSPRRLARQYLNYGRGRARTLRLHGEKLRVRQMLPLAVAPALLAIALAPLWPLAAAPALGWTVVCCVYGAVLAASQRRVCALLSGPAAMLMHAAWSLGFWAQLIGRRPAGGRDATTTEAAR
jgi:succinoglycan biosynthesis protein ExoA